MASISQDDLDAFLLEAELVHERVKALAQNKITTEEFDLVEKKRAEEAKRKEEVKRKKVQEQLLSKKNGRAGKGISKDFASFCRVCHWQYELETPQCIKCGKKTMTLQQRQKQLEGMVENYRQKKAKKEARRQKWQMWKKTQSMLPTKLSTQYTKWEAYTSSEEEEDDNQPIVPRNDPNFKALELDLQQRKKKKEAANKKADAYKQKGNKLMGQKKYQQAADCYTLALQEVKDNKAVYTNRALAYLKLGRWQRAIKDCSTVIEYMQCFQKLSECPDLAFKAFSRRALAHKERKQYAKALQDIINALKYNSKDEAARRLKTEIENFIKFEEKSSQLMKENPENKRQQEKETEYNEKEIVKQLAEQRQKHQEKQKDGPLPQGQQPVVQQAPDVPASPVEKIKYYIQNLTAPNIEKLLTLLISQPDLKAVFIKLEGVKRLLEHIQKQEDKGKSIVLLSYIMDSGGVAEKEVWDHNVHKFQSRCLQILGSELKMNSYSELEDYFQIFIALSLNEKYRLLLAQSQQTIEFLRKCYSILITKYKKEPEMVNAYIIYFSNLCKGETKIKQSMAPDAKTIVESLVRALMAQTKNKKVHQLQKSIYIFISNLVTNPSIKEQVLANASILSICSDQLKSFPKSSELYEPYIQAVLSVFVNLLYHSNEDTLKTLSKLNVEDALYERFISPNKMSQIFLRSLNILSKLDYKGKEIPKGWISKFQGYFSKEHVQKGAANHALRLLNNLYLTHKELQLPSNLEPICSLLDSDNEVLFCNSCNLLGIWTDSPKHSLKAYAALQRYIPRLINIAKEKVGNMRKSSAILLAKIARDESSKEIFLANHGMDVLKSIANFVLDKK